MTTEALRLPVQWATYPGDCTGVLTESFNVPVPDPTHPLGIRVVPGGNAKGPNTLKELLYPVTAEYDAAAGTTRVGFSYIAPPAEVPA